MPAVLELNWAPDGTALVLFAGPILRGDIGHLYIVDITTHESVPLTSGEMMDYLHAVWSPAGDLIALVSTLRDPQGIWLLPVSGGDPQFVMDGQVVDWSPTGEQLVIGRILVDSGQSHAELVVVDVDTRAVSRLTIASGEFAQFREVAWSPDGRRVATSVEILEGVTGPSYLTLYIATSDLESMWQLASGQVLLIDWLDSSRVLSRVIPGSADGDSTELRIDSLDNQCRRVSIEGGTMGWPRLAPGGIQMAFVGSDNAAYVFDLAAAFQQGLWEAGVPCE